MKGLFLTAALGVVCVSAFGQGTVNFANGGAGLVARVTDWSTGVGLSGSAWSADLYWAAGTVTDPTKLVALNQPATFSTIPSQAGFFFGGPRTVPVPSGQFLITAQIRVWDTASGSTWTAAWAMPTSRLGESILFQVTLADPPSPPGIPTTMTALNGHPWQVDVPVPEPSTLALTGLGLAAVLVRSRKLALTLMLAVVCVSALAQGTLNFANGGAGLQAKVTDWYGAGLSGSQWEADLFWAAGTVTDSTMLVALNEPATFSTIPSQAGFFFGGPRTVPVPLPYGQFITAQVRVWNAADGSSWIGARNSAWSSYPYERLGESTLFQVQLADPNASPPGIPTTMTGLNGHPWSLNVLVPEPSASALLGLGLAGICCRLRTRAAWRE